MGSLVRILPRPYISAMHLFICFFITDFVCKNLPVSEKKNLDVFLFCSCLNLWPPEQGQFDPEGMIWTNLVEVHKEMLHTKYKSTMPSSFNDWMVFYAAFNSISVISRRQLTLFTSFLGFTSTRLELWSVLPKDTLTKNSEDPVLQFQRRIL